MAAANSSSSFADARAPAGAAASGEYVAGAGVSADALLPPVRINVFLRTTLRTEFDDPFEHDARDGGLPASSTSEV